MKRRALYEEEEGLYYMIFIGGCPLTSTRDDLYKWVSSDLHIL